MRHPRPRVGGICTQLWLPPPPGLPPQPRPTQSAREAREARWWEQRPGSGCAPRGWFPVGARQGGSILSLHSQGQEKDGVGAGGSLRPWVDPGPGWGPRGGWVAAVPPVGLKGPPDAQLTAPSRSSTLCGSPGSWEESSCWACSHPAGPLPREHLLPCPLPSSPAA